MESLRCGEALLRSSQPLFSFLTPPTCRASPIARHCRSQRSQCLTSRSFTTTPYRRQQAAAAQKEESESYDSPSNNFPSTTPSAQGAYENEISSLLDDTLDFNKGTPTAPDSRTSHFHSRNAQMRNPPSRGLASELAEARRGGDSSADDLINSLTSNAPRNRSSPRSDTFSDISRMLDPLGNQKFTLGHADAAPEVESAPMKLGPTVGRTITVNPARNMDVGRAFRQLEILCARNNVRRDSMRQRFHERPGMKRKRLKSERWRKNFKDNFKGVVAMVQKMRKQGW